MSGTDTRYATIPAGVASGPVHNPENVDPSLVELWAAGGLKGWQERQLENTARHVALMSGIEQLVAHLGGILDAGQSAPVSDVLYQGTLLIPANGYLTTQAFKQNYASIAIANVGGASIAVQNGGIEGYGAPPPQGSGIVVIPAGVFRCFNMRGTTLTIYGAAGAAVDICVYARPRPPAAGTCGEGVTTPQLVNVPNPGAGNQVSVVPSAVQPFQLLTWTMELTTDAVAGNRFPQLTFTPPGAGAVPSFVLQTVFAVPASNAEFYYFAQGAFGATTPQPILTANIPSIWWPAGTVIASKFAGTFDAGDAWSQINYTYRTAQ